LKATSGLLSAFTHTHAYLSQTTESGICAEWGGESNCFWQGSALRFTIGYLVQCPSAQTLHHVLDCEDDIICPAQFAVRDDLDHPNIVNPQGVRGI
jgi:hypothetical protein